MDRQIERMNKILEALSIAIPNPASELHYRSAFEFLVAVMLSPQTTDQMVNRVTDRLFRVANTPKQLLELGLEKLEHQLRTLGFYRVKSRHLLATCERLIADFGGKVPDCYEKLRTLPGVGRKVAHVVLNSYFKRPVLAVDTHVMRVTRRLGFSNSQQPLVIERDLMNVIEKRWLLKAGNLLLLHGRYTCVAKKPNCLNCAIRVWCPYGT